MSDHSRRQRFRPDFGAYSLEVRSLMTATGPMASFEDAATMLRPLSSLQAQPIPAHVDESMIVPRAAAQPSRPNQVLRAASRLPKRPPGRPIVPARNGTSVELPGILPPGATLPSQFEKTGDWGIRVTLGSGENPRSAVLDVPPNEPIEVVDETHASLPEFDDSAFGWLKGQRLEGIVAQEGVVSGALVADSVEIRLSDDAEGEPLVADVDYRIDPFWGTVGRLPGGRLGESDAVTIRYRYVSPRLDAVILQADGQIVLRSGTPSNVSPSSPAPEAGEKLLGRVFLTRYADGLSSSDLFPVESTESSSVAVGRRDTVASRMPKLSRKLRTGAELRILAWGDSVTDGQYMDDPDTQRWQEQFITLLKARYPQANVILITEAWPAHGSADYLNAAEGDSKRFESSVIGQKPDLVISEFVNDTYLASPGVNRQYGQIRSAFKKAGIEWIAMTPHFTHPRFMGFESASEAVVDNRDHVSALRRFGVENRVLIADASSQWADLKRQGMPYMALLSNGINHPNALGQMLYANTLMAYF